MKTEVAVEWHSDMHMQYHDKTIRKMYSVCQESGESFFFLWKTALTP